MRILLLPLSFLALATTPALTPAADEAPGRADPVASAKPGEYRLEWTADANAQDDGMKTVIVIGPAVGVRNLVSVDTISMAGVVMARYQATAFLDRAGDIHIDGRGAPLEEHDGDYSPDSFAIHRDGSVAILDDNQTEAHAKVVNAAPPAAKPGEAKQQ